MKNSINVSSLISAIKGEATATGTVTKAVQTLYDGCTTPVQFIERRKAVNAAIDAKVSDTETAKKYKARTNAVLCKYILKPANIVLTNRGTKARGKGGKAAKANKTAKPSKAAQAATLQSMTTTDIVAAVTAYLSGKPKADAIAIRDRIVSAMTTTINNLK